MMMLFCMGSMGKITCEKVDKGNKAGISKLDENNCATDTLSSTNSGYQHFGLHLKLFGLVLVWNFNFDLFCVKCTRNRIH